MFNLASTLCTPLNLEIDGALLLIGALVKIVAKRGDDLFFSRLRCYPIFFLVSMNFLILLDCIEWVIDFFYFKLMENRVAY